MSEGCKLPGEEKSVEPEFCRQGMARKSVVFMVEDGAMPEDGHVFRLRTH